MILTTKMVQTHVLVVISLVKIVHRQIHAQHVMVLIDLYLIANVIMGIIKIVPIFALLVYSLVKIALKRILVHHAMARIEV